MTRSLQFGLGVAVCLLCCAGVFADNVSASTSTNPPLARIAFGSCNKEYLPQPMWDVILSNHPDLWIWTGDNVYGDTEDMEELSAKYVRQKTNPGYCRLLAVCPVIGTWDDHDYGVNSGGKEYPQRVGSQRALLDFLDEPTNSPRWFRQGVYTSYVYGPAEKQVKVILLDTRYHREDPGPNSDMLGFQQWRWLEKELRASSGRINVIVSSIQVLSAEHPYEKWSNFPSSRKRLLHLLEQIAAPTTIVISGDRHLGEISRYDSLTTGPLYDVTSSGLTHSYRGVPREPNRLRVGEIFHQKNFGLLEIDWNAHPARVNLQIRNEHNVIVNSTELLLD